MNCLTPNTDQVRNYLKIPKTIDPMRTIHAQHLKNVCDCIRKNA